jgi:hypothetical protein
VSMEIRNQKPAPASEPRRFSAGRAAPNKAGANSFADALRKAATPSDPPVAPEQAPAAQPAIQPEPAEAKPSASEAEAAAAPDSDAAGVSDAAAVSDDAFADHMELVRFRLKTGYYASKAINDALSDKLSGYFDELA